MRRLGMLLVGAALAGLAAPAHAATILDGVRNTSHTYDGTLTEPVLLTMPIDPTLVARRATAPEPADCSDASCHRIELVLRVPRGIDTGAFTFRVTPQPVLATPSGVADLLAYGVYDDKGNNVGYWGPSSAPQTFSRPQDALGARPTTAARPIVISRLTPGRYTLVVYNLGGPTSFSAAATWAANKPSRETP